MKEYEMLRQEILDNVNVIVQYNTLLYTVTAAVLAFAIDKESPFMCLIPYVALIPIYLLSEDQHQTTARIAAYMIVFLEGDEHHWETRLYAAQSMTKTIETPVQKIILSRSSQMPYLLITFVCFICAIYKVVIGHMTNIEKWISVLIIVIPTVFIIVTIVRHAKQWVDVKATCIKEWQAVKAAEEIEARKKRYKIGNYKNNRNPQ